VRVYAYGEIEQALADLTTGGCDALMKLAPVTAWLVRDRPRLKVVETGIIREVLGICVRRGDDELRNAFNKAQRALLEDGTLPRLSRYPFQAQSRRRCRTSASKRGSEKSP